jgi:type I restriction enzyme, S subunit
MSEGNGRELPQGWHWAPFEDVADILAGNPAPQGDEYFDEQGQPFVRVQDMGRLGARVRLIDTKDHVNDKAAATLQLFPAGAVLFTKSGASTLLNQRAILSSPMYVVSHIAAAIPRDGIVSEWLYHWLSTVDFAHYAHATTLPSLPLSKVKAIAAPIAPTSEQSRIVDVLDELFSDLDAGAALLERVCDKLKLYRVSVLKAAVEGALTAEWRNHHPQIEPASELLERVLGERRQRWEADKLRKFKEKDQEPPKSWKAKYKEPAAPDIRNLPSLPEGWCWTNLDTLIVEGPQNGLYLPSTLYGYGTEILRIDDFQNGWVRPRDELKRVKASRQDLAIYALQDRDLVINRVNSMTHLGKCVLATDKLKGVLFESNMMRAQVASAVEVKFAELYLRSEFGRRRLTKEAKWAVNQASINQQDVKRTPLPMPPLAEQKAIVEIVEGQLSVIDHLEADLNVKLKSTQVLRQAILRQAFTGKLVPQDPSNEPASELLKRIAADREQLAREAAAAKRSKGRQPRRASMPRIPGKAERTVTKETINGRISDR